MVDACIDGGVLVKGRRKIMRERESERRALAGARGRSGRAAARPSSSATSPSPAQCNQSLIGCRSYMRISTGEGMVERDAARGPPTTSKALDLTKKKNV
jgi:hypothetical protein